MSNIALLIVFIISLIFLGGVFAYIFITQIKQLKSQMNNDSDAILMQWLQEMKGSMDTNTTTLERQLKDQRESLTSQFNTHRETLTNQLHQQRQSLDEQTKLIWERLDNASKVIGDVHKHLGGIQEFTKDMKDLSNILKSPKLRGGLGEQFLYELLENSLPKDMFKTQYKFSDGSICDAVIFTEKGIIPIDSKFPMENFKLMLTLESQDERDKAKKVFIRDVKKRIDEIASKYILPEQGTTDQAVMYVPSENVYYELIVHTPEIEEYSKLKNVVLSSPNTLSYFLKVILVAYQQHELQKHAGDILKALSGIRIEAEKFNEDLGVLDGHITRTYKSVDNVKLKFQKLFSKIESVQALGEADVENAQLSGDSAEVELNLDQNNSQETLF